MFSRLVHRCFRSFRCLRHEGVIALMMEAITTSEASASFLEKTHLYTYRRENKEQGEMLDTILMK